MKKFLGFLAIGALTIALLGGCASSNLKDGTYVGTSSSDERGNYGVVTVTVKSGKISDVAFDEINSADDQPKTAENYTYEAAIAAIKSLPAKLKETKDVTKVDNVTGATGTTNKFKEGANSALAQADKNYKSVLRNGTYTLKSGLDSHGYYSVLTATIANNQFSNVAYEEYNSEDVAKKDAGYSYTEALTAIEQLPAKMNETKDLAKVDTITGATGTSNTFKSMTQMALNLAQARDGRYTYETQPDDHGYKVVAHLALNNGKIIGFSYDELNAEGKSKTDPAVGYTWQQALTFLSRDHLKQVIATQYGVDLVTGATGSHSSVETAIKALVEMAK